MITVKLSGERSVIHAFTAWNQRTIDRAKFVVRRNTLALTNNAKTLAPVRGGRLRNSLADSYEDDGLTGVSGTNLSYAPYVEFGTGIYAVGGNGRKTPWVYYSPELGRFVRTVGSPPKPFLLPSFNQQAPIFEREMAQMIREETR